MNNNLIFLDEQGNDITVALSEEEENNIIADIKSVADEIYGEGFSDGKNAYIIQECKALGIDY